MVSKYLKLECFRFQVYWLLHTIQVEKSGSSTSQVLFPSCNTEMFTFFWSILEKNTEWGLCTINKWGNSEQIHKLLNKLQVHFQITDYAMETNIDQGGHAEGFVFFNLLLSVWTNRETTELCLSMLRSFLICWLWLDTWIKPQPRLNCVISGLSSTHITVMNCRKVSWITDGLVIKIFFAQ